MLPPCKSKTKAGMFPQYKSKPPKRSCTSPVVSPHPQPCANPTSTHRLLPQHFHAGTFPCVPSRIFPHLGRFGRYTKEPNPPQSPKRRHGSKLGLAEPRQEAAAQKMHPGEVKPSRIMQTFRRRLFHQTPLQTPLPPCLQQVVFLLISK